MFTKMFRLAMRAAITKTTGVSGFTDIDDISRTCYGGGNYEGRFLEALGYALTFGGTKQYIKNQGYGGVVFGTNSSAPTVDDKTIAEVTNCTITSGTLVKTQTDAQDIYSNTFMITNNSTESVTVCEAGMYAKISTSSNDGYLCLVHRITFDPITIAAGDSATVKYEMVVDYPG